MGEIRAGPAQAIVTRRAETRRQYRGAPFAQARSYRAYANRAGADRLERDVPLAEFTTFKIGGPADCSTAPARARAGREAIRAARELGVPYFLLGTGANILVGDGGFRGLVIRNEVEEIEFLDETRVRAASGVRVYHDLIQATVARAGRAAPLRGHPEHGGRRDLAEPALPLAAAGARAHRLHRGGGRVREILTEEGEVRTVDRATTSASATTTASCTTGRTSCWTSPSGSRRSPRGAARGDPREPAVAGRPHPDLWLYPSAGSIFQKIEGSAPGG
jgi:UDP-N-acetylmuramate dehydrogenase